MHIRDINVWSIAGVTNRSLQNLKDGLVILLGRNGIGKTALCRAVRECFFGGPDTTARVHVGLTGPEGECAVDRDGAQPCWTGIDPPEMSPGSGVAYTIRVDEVLGSTADNTEFAAALTAAITGGYRLDEGPDKSTRTSMTVAMGKAQAAVDGARRDQSILVAAEAGLSAKREEALRLADEAATVNLLGDVIELRNTEGALTDHIESGVFPEGMDQLTGNEQEALDLMERRIRDCTSELTSAEAGLVTTAQQIADTGLPEDSNLTAAELVGPAGDANAAIAFEDTLRPIDLAADATRVRDAAAAIGVDPDRVRTAGVGVSAEAIDHASAEARMALGLQPTVDAAASHLQQAETEMRLAAAAAGFTDGFPDAATLPSRDELDHARAEAAATAAAERDCTALEAAERAAFQLAEESAGAVGASVTEGPGAGLSSEALERAGELVRRWLGAQANAAGREEVVNAFTPADAPDLGRFQRKIELLEQWRGAAEPAPLTQPTAQPPGRIGSIIFAVLALLLVITGIATSNWPAYALAVIALVGAIIGLRTPAAAPVPQPAASPRAAAEAAWAAAGFAGEAPGAWTENQVAEMLRTLREQHSEAALLHRLSGWRDARVADSAKAALTLEAVRAEIREFCIQTNIDLEGQLLAGVTVVHNLIAYQCRAATWRAAQQALEAGRHTAVQHLDRANAPLVRLGLARCLTSQIAVEAIGRIATVVAASAALTDATRALRTHTSQRDAHIAAARSALSGLPITVPGDANGIGRLCGHLNALVRALDDERANAALRAATDRQRAARLSAVAAFLRQHSPATDSAQATSTGAMARETISRLREMVARLASARTERARLNEVIRVAAQSIEQEQGAISKLLKRSGATTPDEVRDRLKRFAEFRAWRNRRNELQIECEVRRQRLREHPDISSLDRMEAEARLERATQAQQRHAEIVEQITITEERIAAAKAGNDLSEKLADLEAERVALAATIERRLRIAARRAVVECVQEEARQLGADVLDRASGLLKEFTSDEYSLLPPAKGCNQLRAEERHAGQRPRMLALTELSGGTRVQALIAARIAYIEYLERETRVKLPVFLDEALKHWDDERMPHGVATIAAIARSGRQFFYLTNQRHEAETVSKLAMEANAPVSMIDLDREWGRPV